MNDNNLKSIWLNYLKSKKNGEKCESFGEYTREQFFEEVARRYFKNNVDKSKEEYWEIYRWIKENASKLSFRQKRVLVLLLFE